jgi:hypothetical protein
MLKRRDTFPWSRIVEFWKAVDRLGPNEDFYGLRGLCSKGHSDEGVAEKSLILQPDSTASTEREEAVTRVASCEDDPLIAVRLSRAGIHS